jgi:hypothetical protein
MKIVDIEVIERRVPGWTGAAFDGSYDDCLLVVHTDKHRLVDAPARNQVFV